MPPFEALEEIKAAVARNHPATAAKISPLLRKSKQKHDLWGKNFENICIDTEI